MKHTICQGRQAKLRHQPPRLQQVVMAVMRCPPRFRHLLEMCPAIWQEKILCINSAPEWVCKLNFKLCVMCALWLICLWRIREMLETLQFVYYEVVYLREETARLNFMQLAVFAMPKKQHFEKKIHA
jgi:hypothetical protein